MQYVYMNYWKNCENSHIIENKVQVLDNATYESKYTSNNIFQCNGNILHVVISGETNELYFHAKQLCEILGYTDAILTHVTKEHGKQIF